MPAQASEVADIFRPVEIRCARFRAGGTHRKARVFASVRGCRTLWLPTSSLQDDTAGRARGHRSLPIPEPLFKTTPDRMFRYRITVFPSSELDHLKYSCLVDGTRARAELGFQPKFSLKETLQDLV